MEAGSSKIHAESRKLPADVARKVDKALREALAVLIQRHTSNLESIKTLFPTATSVPPDTRVALVNEGDRVSFDTGDENDILVSHAAIKLLLRSVIYGEVARRSLRRAAYPDDPARADIDITVEAALGEFVGMVHRGTIKDFDDFYSGPKTSGRSRLYDVAWDNFGLASKYSSVLLFCLAHELGHIVLAHINENFFSDCVRRQALEAQADFYGAYLVYSLIAPYALASHEQRLVVEFPDFSDEFFTLVYASMGFNEPDTRGCYPYPPNGKRIAATNLGKALAFDDARADLPTISLEGLSEFFVSASRLGFKYFNTTANIYAIRLYARQASLM